MKLEQIEGLLGIEIDGFVSDWGFTISHSDGEME